MKIFIVNGKPNSGKTTFEKIVRDILEDKVVYMSIITPVNKMLESIGIDSTMKNEATRKLKSDIKIALDSFEDYLFNDCIAAIESLKKENTDCKAVFCDMREYKDIEKAKAALGAKAIYIENNSAKDIESNIADANVENNIYDVVIENNGDIHLLEETAKTFVDNFILNNE